MAGLRLDTREGAFAERKTVPILKPGDAMASRLLRGRSRKTRDAHASPASGRSLSEKDIDVLRRWIDQGAKWNTHWAYTAPGAARTARGQELNGLATRSTSSSWRAWSGNR